MNTVNFDKLVGSKADLYYCNEVNRFQLGSVLFEAVEDEGDGYRSNMEEVIVVDTNKPKQGLLAEVTIKSSNTIEGYSLIDDEGYTWLTFGTECYDEYYPCFIFNTFPKPSLEDELLTLIK